jgi:hypothetical protein
VTGQEQVYTVDPDGTDEHLVADNSEVGQWSPEGTSITLFGELGELLFNVDNGSSVDLGLPGNLYPDLQLFCGVWSPNGARLACEGFGQTDPSLNGVYTLRAADGGDLQRVTYEPNGDDCPSDYSPNGKNLVVTRASDTSYGSGSSRRTAPACGRSSRGPTSTSPPTGAPGHAVTPVRTAWRDRSCRAVGGCVRQQAPISSGADPLVR